MHTIRSKIQFKQIRTVSAVFLSILLSACAQAAAPTLRPTSPQDKAALIEQLETAKRLDWNDALDSSVAPATQEDFLEQMNKADRAIKELSHGFPVSQPEISDALWVPPKSMSAEQKDRLIGQLQDAIQQDDRNEQEMLIDLSWSEEGSINTSTYDRQKELADNVIKDLEIGEDVHWSTIKEALQVPRNPY